MVGHICVGAHKRVCCATHYEGHIGGMGNAIAGVPVCDGTYVWGYVSEEQHVCGDIHTSGDTLMCMHADV